MFDDITASLAINDNPSHPRARSSRRLPGRAEFLLVAVILLVLGWLVMTLGWPGVLIACAVSAVLLELNSRRRQTKRR